MTRDTSWDNGEDPADYAGDFVDDADYTAVLDAFDDFSPPVESNEDWISRDAPHAAEDVQQDPTVFFTVTNPSGSVSTTALISGRIHQVDLSSQVTSMTESELAEEVVLLATLAREKAQAAQHAVVKELMHSMGHDPAMLGGFLEREIGLPSPETVATRTAAVFATRYRTDSDG